MKYLPRASRGIGAGIVRRLSTEGGTVAFTNSTSRSRLTLVFAARHEREEIVGLHGRQCRLRVRPLGPGDHIAGRPRGCQADGGIRASAAKGSNEKEISRTVNECVAAQFSSRDAATTFITRNTLPSGNILRNVLLSQKQELRNTSGRLNENRICGCSRTRPRQSNDHACAQPESSWARRGVHLRSGRRALRACSTASIHPVMRAGNAGGIGTPHDRSVE